MKGFVSHPVTKVIATLLVIILSGLCAIAVGAALYMYTEGYYQSDVGSYYDTTTYHRVTDIHAINAYNTWKDTSQPLGKIEDSWYKEESSNFAYSIVQADAPDTVLAFNFKPEKSVREHLLRLDDYVVKCYINDPIVFQDDYYESYWLFQLLYGNRYKIPVVTAVGALVCVAALAILIAGAGRRWKTEGIVLRGQDRIPLDIYLLAGGLLVAILVSLMLDTMYNRFYNDFWAWLFAGWMLMLICCIGIALVTSTVARGKAGKWWINTVSYHLLRLCGRFLRFLWKMCVTLVAAVPLIWKVLVAFCIASLINFLLLYQGFYNYNYFALFMSAVFNLVLFVAVGFCALNMQRLKQAGERLSEGDFEQRVDKRWMVLDFLQHAENLDSIGDGMAIAVQQRMKSERLKTELITNVSHDIKTPLTSIINYVDLIRKEQLPDQAAEYAAVLERHAGRLKKLTEDIVEASKASTGALPVMLQRTNLCELVSQSLGEYTERLEECRLDPIATIPEDEHFIMVDGKLLWRVMDNLLGNVCKYGQPDTRVYIDVKREGNNAAVIIKNISRNRLNLEADELIERFARGDAARATEGSGLGLNIAQSLVELQKGGFGLAIDGDLFKAELRFALIE